jgi:hypothetical protein
VDCSPDRTGGIQHLRQCQRSCRQHLLHVKEEEVAWTRSQMGWDLKAVQIERREKMSAMRPGMAQAIARGLGWIHVDWVQVHSRGQSALQLCAFYARLCCESVVDSRGMRG